VAKPVSAPKSTPASSGRPAGLFTWVAVGVVVVIVAALVIVKVVGGGPTSTNSGTWVATDATTATEVTSVAASVFDTIAVSQSAAVTAPIALKGQPALTAKLASGTVVPEVLYIGAEYCPYCAAQRWATIAALGRFGTWSGLGNTESSSVDMYANTPTFTFLKATYTSKYLVFKGVEELNNVYNANTNPPYGKLMTPTKQEQAIFAKYDTSKYINMSARNDGAIPFISMGNELLVSGASYNPGLLNGLTRTQIASNLSATSSPITKVIITSANEQTAAICKLTNQQPSNVCDSAGVKAAKTLMKL
jgi:thiol-disulfide isomerase/thioredoxin